jgi:AraC-like DNA-binding protein
MFAVWNSMSCQIGISHCGSCLTLGAVKTMRCFWLFFLFLPADSGMAQNQTLDSLSSFLKNYPKEDTVKVNALNDLSSQYLWIDYYLSIKHADSALELARSLNYSKGIATANNLKGFCYWAFGDNELAIQAAMEASSLMEQEGSLTQLAESFLILSRAYADLNEDAKAAIYVDQAEKISLQTKNWAQLSSVYNWLGVLAIDRKDSALLYFKKALSIAQEHNVPKINIPRILSNMAECYIDKNPDLAFTYFNNALLMARETGNKTAEASTSSIVGRAYFRMGDNEKAETHLLAALQLARQLGLRRTIQHAYGGLVRLRLQQGRASEAVDYMRNYYEVRDSLLSTVKTRQIVELEARHEIEKKEQAIKLLEQEKQIQVLWRNILIATLVLLALTVAIVLYLRQYNENKNRKILNLEIDYLTAQHNELSIKYKDTLLQTGDQAVESQDQRLLKLAVEVVEHNIQDSGFGVEKMAKEMGMSRTNMHRKIKAITGFPPSELIRSIRLKRAANLLINQADSVSQIGLMVGFDDQSYFSKSFKKQYGVPPSEYLASVRQTEQLAS